MTRSALFAATAAMALALSAACGGGSSQRTAASPAATPSSAAQVAAARQRQDARIRFLEDRAAGDPLDVFSLNSLAQEHMQRARETGDVSELTRAEQALDRSLRIRRNDNYEGIILLASVSATKHDFARALDLAQQAIPQKPGEAYGYGVLGDAYMGLGRYDEADFAYEKMVTIAPDLSAFGRRALLFQARGRIEDAEASWQDAIRDAAGDGVPEHSAWAHAQLANLLFSIGRVDAAGENYRQSLDVFPGYVHALAGLGRVAAAQGDLGLAANYYTRAINTVPLPEYVSALGDVYAAAGDEKNASSQYELIGAIEQLYAANGVNLDLQIALFNADHGREITATVERARRAAAAQPSIQAADVLAWAEYQAGNIDAAKTAIERALSTGTVDPLIAFHAGVVYKAAGEPAKAKEYLTRLEARTPQFSVRYAGQAKEALDELNAPQAG